MGIEKTQYDCVLRNISHYFGPNQVLHDVSLSIRKGEFFGILGPSGSGKTTTLHAALGHINQPGVKIWTAEDPIEITHGATGEMVFTAILGIVFLGEFVSRRFWLGGFLILASNVLLNIIKAKQISHIT